MRLGREIARIALERIGKKATNKALSTAAKQLTRGDTEELLAMLGAAELQGRDIVEVLYPELVSAADEAAPPPDARFVLGLEDGQDARQAICCRPVPGERIVGIAEKGEGVVVHAIDCDTLAAYEDKRGVWMDLHWPEASMNLQPVLLRIVLANDPGVLGRICTLVGEQKANISDIVFTDRKPDFYRMVIEVEVRDIKHLLHVITAIEADSDVTEVERYREPAMSSAPFNAAAE